MDEDHHFCLRWNNHQSTITSVFATLFENEKLVDCTLAAEGKSIKAHKVVLAACSPYFATLLSQQYDKQPIFILKDVKYQELQAMVNYMYFGEVSISQEHLAGLLRAAESLEIIGLSDNRARNQQKHIFDEQQHKHTNLPDKLSVKSAAADKNTLQTKPSRIGKSSTASQNVYNQERSPVSTLRRRKIARRRINDNILPNNQGSSSPPEVIKALTSSTTNSTTAVLPIFDNRVAGIVPRITENILTDNHCSFSLPEVIQAGTSSLSAKNSIETITSRLPIVSTGVAGTLPRSTKNNLVGNQDSLSSSGVIQTGTTSATNSTGTITTVLPIAGNSFAGTVPINTGIIASSFLAVPSLQQQQTSDTTRPENTTTANRNKKIETEKMGTTDQMKTSTSLDLTNFDVKNAEVEENKETYLNRPTYHQHEGGTTSATGKAEILLKSENDDEDLEDSDNNHGPSQGDEKFAQWKEDKTHQRDPKDMSLDCEQSMTTNSGRLPCNVCGKSYLRKRHLQRHMRDECIGIPPRFKCDLCPARFRRNYHMVRHMTSKHGIPSIDGPENLSMKRIYYENKYFPESGKYAISKADKTALPDVNTTYPEPVPANNTAPSAYSGSDEENKQQNNIAQEEETTPISIKTEPISPSKLTLPMDEDWKMKLRLQLISNSFLKDQLMNSMPFAYNT